MVIFHRTLEWLVKSTDSSAVRLPEPEPQLKRKSTSPSPDKLHIWLYEGGKSFYFLLVGFVSFVWGLILKTAFFKHPLFINGKKQNTLFITTKTKYSQLDSNQLNHEIALARKAWSDVQGQALFSKKQPNLHFLNLLFEVTLTRTCYGNG